MKTTLLAPAIFIFLALGFNQKALAQDNTGLETVRIGVAGLVHTHVHWLLGREDRGDIEIVGIAEPNRELAERYLEQHGLSMNLWYPSLEEMVRAEKPDAVCAFTTTADHLKVVRVCANRGIHVMVEKPLALNMQMAIEMAELAEKHNIHLLTNYESTWYGSVQQAHRLVTQRGQLGDLRKLEAHHGHPGPVAIGVNDEFLEWLIDPELNGGGVIPDFACYGANLFNYFLQGERPLTVTTIAATLQPDLYPNVEDEATIILTYPTRQAVIQASWNWSDNRKSLYLHGTEGYIYCIDGENMRMYTQRHPSDRKIPAPKVKAPRNDPFAYLAVVVNGLIIPEPWECSALPNNLLVMEILDAALRSVREGKTITLDTPTQD